MRTETLLIGDRHITTADRDPFAVACPATLTPVAMVPTATEQDAYDALETASAAFNQWRQATASQRSNLLLKIAARLDEKADMLGRLMTEEQGKPLAEAIGEAEFIGEEFRFAAAEAERLNGEILPAPALDVDRFVRTEPAGVVVALPSSNYPAAIAARKISALLAAGCAGVIRAPEEAPSAAIFIVKTCLEAGLPAGVLNVLSGNPAGVTEALITDPRSAMVSFTGSNRVGQIVLGHAAQTITPALVELGGTAPLIVGKDTDIGHVAPMMVNKKHENAGQNCAAPNYALVHRDIYDAFAEAYWAAAQSIRVGNGRDADVTMGPLVSAAGATAMRQRVDALRQAGATLHQADAGLPSEGHFVAPTLATDVPSTSSLLHEEVFAPLMPMVAFDDIEEAVAIANKSPFGLAAYAFTGSQWEAHFIARELSVGSLALNKTGVGDIDAPFGGYGQSGFGTEGGRYGIDAFLRRKFVSMRYV